MKKILLGKIFVGLMLISSMGFSQQRTVSGKVTSAEDGSALPGVNVLVKGTTTGTVTTINGTYSIEIPAGATTLTFSFIGFKAQEVDVNGRTVVDVTLENDITQLQEVVVTGYGTTLKKEFSGSTATIGSDAISKLPSLSVNQALQGQASGVFVTANSGAPGGGISVRVRGQTSINGSNDPLYVIDGVPVVAGNISQDGFGGQTQNALAGLNPQDIENIEILKDASSTAIYGTRGANGVVLITTKRGRPGKSTININAWTGFAEPVGKIDLLSAIQIK